MREIVCVVSLESFFASCSTDLASLPLSILMAIPPLQVLGEHYVVLTICYLAQMVQDQSKFFIEYKGSRGRSAGCVFVHTVEVANY